MKPDRSERKQLSPNLRVHQQSLPVLHRGALPPALLQLTQEYTPKGPAKVLSLSVDAASLLGTVQDRPVRDEMDGKDGVCRERAA